MMQNGRIKGFGNHSRRWVVMLLQMVSTRVIVNEIKGRGFITRVDCVREMPAPR